MLVKIRNALVIYNLAVGAILLTLMLGGSILLGATVASVVSKLGGNSGTSQPGTSHPARCTVDPRPGCIGAVPTGNNYPYPTAFPTVAACPLGYDPVTGMAC